MQILNFYSRIVITYEELAVAVGSTKSLIWRYENGKSDPGLPALIKLADYFGVTLDWLGGGGDFEKIQYAGKEKYYNAINKCIENEISPERLEQIIIPFMILALILTGCVIEDPADTTADISVEDNDKEKSAIATSNPASEEGNEEKDNDEASNDKASSNELKKYGVGETIDIKGVSIVLESVEKSYGDRDEDFSFTAPAEGKVFVICNFFVENNSKEDFNINSFYFQAYEDGFSIDEYMFVSGLEVEGLSGTASSGKKIKGALVYEISEQFEELELEYEPSIWNDKKITFLITNE